MNVLDVGCGTGFLSLFFAKEGHVVTGVDMADSILQKGREKAAARGLQVQFQQGDAQKLPFSSGSFDLNRDGASPFELN